MRMKDYKRVKRRVKNELKKHSVDVPAIVKEYIEEKAKRERSKDLIGQVARYIKKNVKPSKAGFATKSIREDRDEVH